MKTIEILHLVLWSKMPKLGRIYPVADGRTFRIRQAIDPRAAGFNFAGDRSYFLLIRLGPRRDFFKEIFVVARHAQIVPQGLCSRTGASLVVP